jgi:subtilisin family serine protease
MEAIGRLKGGAEIEYVEPNYIYQHHATSNDPYYTNGSLWGMYGGSTSPANQFGSHAGVAWANNKTGSSTVVIGIIDEGVMHSHPDLQANIWTNPGEIPGNGIDDDGNGYIDDVYGWDFDGNDNSTYDGAHDDHGTHVAGTIGAVGGNGTGVAGVVWNVKMITAKFLGRNGGTTANAVKSVDYMTDLKSRHGLHLVATNNSWGGGGYSQALYDAIERANRANILFMAAAGNGGSDGVGDDNDTTPSLSVPATRMLISSLWPRSRAAAPSRASPTTGRPRLISAPRARASTPRCLLKTARPATAPTAEPPWPRRTCAVPRPCMRPPTQLQTRLLSKTPS